MKNLFPSLFILITLLIFGCTDDDFIDPVEGFFAIANRTSGTVSIYNSKSLDKTAEIVLPDEDAAPTYVVHSEEKQLLYISDFNTQKVWVYNTPELEFVNSFPIEAGGFHMWGSDRTDQLWVNNIVSKTTSVINTNSGETLATLPLEVDGIEFEEDAAQHDVIISSNGRFAYVSVFSQTGANYVIQYNTSNFKVMNIEEVGGDPHLSANRRNLFILSQDDANIKEYRFANLKPTGKMASIPNAHGVTPRGNRSLFITNISGRQIATYDVESGTTTSTVDASASAGVSHNVAFGKKGRTLASTNSGGTTVDFFKANRDGELTLLQTDESGGNPFGLVYFEVETSDYDEDEDDDENF